ncbi:hypothetical protein TCSYLVIO_008749, partial [Trypanosoma cruzi]
FFHTHTHTIAQAAVTRSTRHIHHHLLPAHSHSQREMAKTRGHHTTHPEQAPTTTATRASEPSSIHDAATKFQPSRPQWDTEPNSTQSHAVHHTRRKIDAGWRSLSSLLLMATEEDNSRHTQLPACTAKEAFKSTATCILCVAAETQSKKVKRGSRVCGETHNGNNNKKTAQTHDCSAAQAAAIHTRFIENKKKSPSTYKPHQTK